MLAKNQVYEDVMPWTPSQRPVRHTSQATRSCSGDRAPRPLPNDTAIRMDTAINRRGGPDGGSSGGKRPLGEHAEKERKNEWQEPEADTSGRGQRLILALGRLALRHDDTITPCLCPKRMNQNLLLQPSSPKTRGVDFGWSKGQKLS